MHLRKTLICRILQEKFGHHELWGSELGHIPRGNARYTLLLSHLTSIPLTSLAVARKIPFDEPNVLLYVRIGYVVSQIAILAVYYFISYRVRMLRTDVTCA